MADRSELWVALSRDGGRSWSEPRFLLANALQPAFDTPFRNHQCSYMDLFIDRGTVHLFIPHRWQQVTCLRFPENPLPELLNPHIPRSRLRDVSCGAIAVAWRGDVEIVDPATGGAGGESSAYADIMQHQRITARSGRRRSATRRPRS